MQTRRASSIRTRIKTSLSYSYLLQRLSRRASSIRTRIKTDRCSTDQNPLPLLAEHLPLEQGLRLHGSELFNTVRVLAEHLPLEQGLRHLPFPLQRQHTLSRRASSIRTRIKTNVEVVSTVICRPLAEHLPLEQGLRLGLVGDCYLEWHSQSIFH